MNNAESRFFDKVEKSSGCWLWVGAKQKDGYGMFTPSGRGSSVSAHRYSYALKYGEIPAGKNILHRCDTPSCVNPDHLFLGTRSDNMQDMQEKGRCNYLSGGKSHMAKLTDEDVRSIRENYRGEKHSDVAKIYCVHRTTISNILNRKTWV